MKNILVLFILIAGFTQAQNSFGNEITIEPVKINHTTKISGDSIFVYINFEVEDNWMVYDSLDGEVGPIPISISTEGSTGATMQKIIKPELKQKFDDIFEVNLWYFQHSATYELIFTANEPTAVINISGEYMACNLTSGVCLPPAPFTFSVKK